MEDCRRCHLLAQESGLSHSFCYRSRSLDHCETAAGEEQLHHVLQEKNKMKGFPSYGKQAGVIQTKVPPEESEDS